MSHVCVPECECPVLLRHNYALRRLRMKIVEKGVFPRRQGFDDDKGCDARRNDFFLSQWNTFKFRSASARIRNFNLDALTGGRFDAGRREPAVFHLQFECRQRFCMRAHCHQKEERRDAIRGDFFFFFFFLPFLPIPAKTNSYSAWNGLNHGPTPVSLSVWRPKDSWPVCAGGAMKYFKRYLPGPNSLTLSP